MNEPIRRSAYPDTRDEQAMRRFMAGTLNVGHHLTFQRKGMIVNVSPQSGERDIMNRFFDSKGIHKNDHCVNAKLTMFPDPVSEEVRLSRETEYDIYPYSYAQIALTPAEAISETGKKRNMHLQTHNDLPDAPTLLVYGVGHRKGELAMLQFVKDTVTFQTDLDRDEAEEAARRRRPFVTPWAADPTQQLMSMPAHPSMQIRDLFETQSEMASTPSDIAYQAQRTALRLQTQPTPYQQLQQHVSPNRTLLGPQQPTSGPGAATHVFSRYQPSLLVSHYDPPSEHAQVTNARQPASMPPIAPSPSHAQANNYVPQNVPDLSQLEATVQCGMAAAREIFPLERNEESQDDTKKGVPRLPDTKHFLDLERCRLVLRNIRIPAHEMFASWQAHQMRTRQPSCANTSADDSGVGLPVAVQQREASPCQTRPSTSQAVPTADMQFGGAESWDQSAWQMISPERPSRTARQASMLYQGGSQTPRMRAASTLSSLSPAKSGGSSRRRS